MRDAGHPERAALLNAEGAGSVSLAYYADLFVQPEAQGGSDVASELAPIMASARTAHTPIAAERAS